MYELYLNQLKQKYSALMHLCPQEMANIYKHNQVKIVHLYFCLLPLTAEIYNPIYYRLLLAVVINIAVQAVLAPELQEGVRTIWGIKGSLSRAEF